MPRHVTGRGSGASTRRYTEASTVKKPPGTTLHAKRAAKRKPPPPVYQAIKVHKIPYEAKWHIFTDDDLKTWAKPDRQKWEEIIWDFEKNRLKYFLPHGPIGRWSPEKDEFVIEDDEGEHMGPGSAGAEFLSDYEHQTVMLVKPNQKGGTAHGVAFSLLRIIPCDPTWPVFTMHGVKYRPWTGPKRWLIAGYAWETVGCNLWPEYMRLLPRSELGHYADDWGEQDGEKGVQRSLSFANGRTREVALTCGTQIAIKCYRQAQSSYSGGQYDGAHLDEQIPELLYDEYIRGLSTRDIWVPQPDGSRKRIYMAQTCFTLTPHVRDGYPETGAGGWLKRKMFDGSNRKGLSFACYKLTTKSTPDAICPPEKKKEEYERLVVGPETARPRDMRSIRAGRSRFFGDWEPGGGLVLNMWDRDLHVIDDFEIPFNKWTLYRITDHGDSKSPTATMWAAVDEKGTIFVYRDFYRFGSTIVPNAAEIVRLSGNEVRDIGEEYDPETGTSWIRREEVFIREHYVESLLDGRTFEQTNEYAGKTKGELYNLSGMECTPAPGTHNRDAIGVMNEYLYPDPDRRHYVTGEMGGPRVYVFKSCRHFIAEAESWLMLESLTGEPKAANENDHLMCCYKWLLSVGPTFMGSYEEIHRNSRDWSQYGRKGNVVAPYTGY